MKDIGRHLVFYLFFMVGFAAALVSEQDIGSYPERETFAYNVRILPLKYDVNFGGRLALPTGTYFRVELFVSGPRTKWQLLNASAGEAAVMLIKAFKYDSVHNFCNTTMPWEVLDVVSDLGSADGITRPHGQLNRAYATFEAPSVPFKVCLRRSVSRFFNATIRKLDWTHKHAWQTPNNNGDVVRHINATEVFFRPDASSLFAGDFASLLITRANGSFPHRLVAHTTFSSADTFKLIPKGTKCIEERALSRYSGTYLTTSGAWTAAGIASLGSNSVGGTVTALGTAAATWQSGLSSPTGPWVVDAAVAHFKVPSAGLYDVCYSSFYERLELGSLSPEDQSPPWRKLALANRRRSPYVWTIVVQKRSNPVTAWGHADMTAHSWGPLRITGSGLRADGAQQCDGDQVKLVDAFAFRQPTNGQAPRGCFDQGVQSVTKVGGPPTSSEQPWLSAGSATEVFAYVRYPSNTSQFVVCYRRAGESWHVALNRSGGILHRSTMPRSLLRWAMNDTRASTLGELVISSTSNVPSLTTLRTSYASPAIGAVAVRVVGSSGNCMLDLSSAETWDTGLPEDPFPMLVSRGPHHSTSAPQRFVVAYLLIPPPRADGYRVCVRVGDANWVVAGPSLLFPAHQQTAPRMFVRDRRGGSLAKIRVEGPRFSPGDGTFFKLVRNVTICARSDDGVAHDAMPLIVKPNVSETFLLLPTTDQPLTLCMKQDRRNWMSVGTVKPALTHPIAVTSSVANPLVTGASITVRVSPPVASTMTGAQLRVAETARGCYDDGMRSSSQSFPRSTRDLTVMEFHVNIPIVLQRQAVMCFRDRPDAASANWVPLQPTPVSVVNSNLSFSAPGLRGATFGFARTEIRLAVFSASLALRANDEIKLVAEGAACSASAINDPWVDAQWNRSPQGDVAFVTVRSLVPGTFSLCYRAEVYDMQWILLPWRGRSESSLTIKPFPISSVTLPPLSPVTASTLHNRSYMGGAEVAVTVTSLSAGLLTRNDTIAFHALDSSRRSACSRLEPSFSRLVGTSASITPGASTSMIIATTLPTHPGEYALCVYHGASQQFAHFGTMSVADSGIVARVNASGVLLVADRFRGARPLTATDIIRILPTSALCSSNRSTLWTLPTSRLVALSPQLVGSDGTLLFARAPQVQRGDFRVCYRSSASGSMWLSIALDEHVAEGLRWGRDTIVQRLVLRAPSQVTIGAPVELHIGLANQLRAHAVVVSVIGATASIVSQQPLWIEAERTLRLVAFVHSACQTQCRWRVVAVDALAPITEQSFTAVAPQQTSHQFAFTPHTTPAGFLSSATPLAPFFISSVNNRIEFSAFVVDRQTSGVTALNSSILVSLAYSSRDFQSWSCLSCENQTSWTAAVVNGKVNIVLAGVETQGFVFRQQTVTVTVTVAMGGVNGSIFVAVAPVFARQLIVRSVVRGAGQPAVPLWEPDRSEPSAAVTASPQSVFVVGAEYIVVLAPVDDMGRSVSPHVLAGDSVSVSGAAVVTPGTNISLAPQPAVAGVYTFRFKVTDGCLPSCTLAFSSFVFRTRATVTSAVVERATMVTFASSSALNPIVLRPHQPLPLVTIVARASPTSGIDVTATGAVCATGFPRSSFGERNEICAALEGGSATLSNVSFASTCSDCFVEFLFSGGGPILRSQRFQVVAGPYRLVGDVSPVAALASGAALPPNATLNVVLRAVNDFPGARADFVAVEATHWIAVRFIHESSMNETTPRFTVEPAQMVALRQGRTSFRVTVHDRCTACRFVFEVKRADRFVGDGTSFSTPSISISAANETVVGARVRGTSTLWSTFVNASGAVDIEHHDAFGFRHPMPIGNITSVFITSALGDTTRDGNGGDVTFFFAHHNSSLQISFTRGCALCVLRITTDTGFTASLSVVVLTRGTSLHLLQTPERAAATRFVALHAAPPTDRSAWLSVDVAAVDDDGVIDPTAGVDLRIEVLSPLRSGVRLRYSIDAGATIQESVDEPIVVRRSPRSPLLGSAFMTTITSVVITVDERTVPASGVLSLLVRGFGNMSGSQVLNVTWQPRGEPHRLVLRSTALFRDRWALLRVSAVGVVTMNLEDLVVSHRNNRLFVGVWYPFNLVVVDTLDRPVPGFSGNVRAFPNAAGGCSSTAFELREALSPMQDGNATVWIRFSQATVCSVAFAIELASTTQLSALPRLSVSSGALTVRESSSQDIVFALSEVPTSIQTANVSFSVRVLRLLPFGNTFVLAAMTTQSTHVLIRKLVPQNSSAGFAAFGGELRVGDRATTNDAGLLVSVAGAMAEWQMTFTASCRLCHVSLSTLSNGTATIIPVGTGFVVRPANPAPVFSIAEHLQAARNEPFQVGVAFGASSVDVQWDVDAHSAGAVSLSLSPNGGNGGGGLLYHSMGSMTLTETRWAFGFMIWRLVFTSSCFLCEIIFEHRHGRPLTLHLPVFTTATRLSLSLDRAVVDVGQSIAATVGAVDDEGNFDLRAVLGVPVAVQLSSVASAAVPHAHPSMGTGVPLIQHFAAWGNGSSNFTLILGEPVVPSFVIVSDPRLGLTSGENVTIGAPSPPTLTGRCTATRLIVLSAPSTAAEGNQFEITAGAVDATYGRVCANFLATLSVTSPNCGIDGHAGLTAKTFDGRATLPLVIGQITNVTSQRCALMITGSSSAGAQLAAAHHSILVRRVVARALRLLSDTHVVSGVPATLTIAAVESQLGDLVVDTRLTTTVRIVVSPASSICQPSVPSSVMLTRGRGTLQLSPIVGDASCLLNFTITASRAFPLSLSTLLHVQAPASFRFSRNSTLQPLTALVTGEVYEFNVHVTDRFGRVVLGATGASAVRIAVRTVVASPLASSSGPRFQLRTLSGLASGATVPTERGSATVSLVLTEVSEQLFSIELTTLVGSLSLGPFWCRASARVIIPSTSAPIPTIGVVNRPFNASFVIADEYGNVARSSATFVKLTIERIAPIGVAGRLLTGNTPTLSGFTESGVVTFGGLAWSGAAAQLTYSVRGVGVRSFSGTARFQRRVALRLASISPLDASSLREFERVTLLVAVIDDSGAVVVGDDSSEVKAQFDSTNFTNEIAGDTFVKTVAGGVASFSWYARRVLPANFTVTFIVVQEGWRSESAVIAWSRAAQTQVAFKSQLLALSMLLYPAVKDFNASHFRLLVGRAARVQLADIVVERVCPDGIVDADACAVNNSTFSIHMRRYQALQTGVYTEFVIQLTNETVGAAGTIERAIRFLELACRDPTSEISVELRLTSPLLFPTRQPTPPQGTQLPTFVPTTVSPYRPPVDLTETNGAVRRPGLIWCALLVVVAMLQFENAV